MKESKGFKIIISILMGLTMLWGAFCGLGLIAFGRTLIHKSDYGITVAGVTVTRENKGDILGDGTVFYSASSNILTFNNAVIEYDATILHSEIDLRVNLVGENKFICKDNSSIIAIVVSDYFLEKNLSLEGDGSLLIGFQNVSEQPVGIYAGDLMVMTNLTIQTPDNAGIPTGIICFDSLTLKDTANVAVNVGSGQSSAAVMVRGNTIIEPDAKMAVSVNPGCTEACRGFCVEGELVLGKGAALSVTVDDGIAEYSECLSVAGVLDIAADATLTAAAQKANAIECYTSVKLNKGGSVAAATAGENADICCYGAFVNYGGTVDAEVEAFGGIHNKAGN